MADKKSVHIPYSILISTTCLLLLAGCGGNQSHPPEQDLNVSITEPTDRDFDAIKRDGVLRMITSYSSGSYFLYGGVERGFEYELAQKFAKENDLALEVVILKEGDNPYDLLNSGVGDFIAASYTITEERKKYVDFSRPYNLVNQVIVYNGSLEDMPQHMRQMDGFSISVRRNSSYYPKLLQLRKEGIDLAINLVPDEMDTESLLFAVSNGTYDATIADDNLFKAAKKYMSNLRQGPVISERDTIAWALRQNSENLKTAMNRFMYKHFRFAGVNEKPKRSAFLNILRKRYFGGTRKVADYYEPDKEYKHGGLLSPYDQLIERIAVEEDIDPLMLTSIIAQESKFNPESKSWAGAVGLMQIIPRFSEVENEELLYEPETNIREGIRILKEHYNHYAYLDSLNRWKLTLATYNAGLGHLADARRLAVDMNRDPNEWDNISRALLKLMQRKYYKDARYGFCRGIETVRYVREIMNRYHTYQTILDIAERQDRNVSPAMIGISPVLN